MHQIIFKGGLGNQLFCLFYAYKILNKYNTRVSLNLSNYSFSSRNDRSFLVERLYPPLFEEFTKKSSNFSKLLFLYARILEKYFFRSKPERLPGDKCFKINYYPNKFIHSGYFQRITNSTLDRKCLGLFKKKLSPYLLSEKSDNLAIHIRRGDYLSPIHSMHGTIDEKFLIKESENQFQKQDFNGITIFSDSPELINLDCFKNLNKNITIDKGGDPVMVFKRMATHKGLIASNSTFSLWAGILGGIKNFSIPYYWMKNVKSSIIGLENIPRYKCEI